ncbi:four-carbon acid sugar kinase family protein [uncultured Kriegella sp.]|uniref:four-carbon acid sugar kinase family protein n=1 Tax=uncultured Kriegella sp. TaxID=1798910 RepID=UPI0030DC39D1|tara:strand:+ start:83933 stop:85318 length:1386 start_codon:yes stop_codon:yes gene_type:complete
MVHTALLQSIEEGSRLHGCEAEIREELVKNPKSIVILDDDPTGTQTVYDVPVITEWTEEILEKELLTSPVFFILTNSRSLYAEAADALGRLIGQRLQKLAVKHQKKLIVISRSDSTLRGHYPIEVNALAIGLQMEKAKQVLIPAFFEGGRYTYNDIHYVKEGDKFIPAAETPFAKDNTFGYEASNIRDWIIEKSENKVTPDHIASISVQLLRQQSTDAIKTILNQPETTHIVVNATSCHDLQIMAQIALQNPTPLLFRTAASFINAISGIARRACLCRNEILGKTSKNGALVVIGSYVPKTTAQLEYLKKHYNAVFLELEVSNVLNPVLFSQELTSLVSRIDRQIGLGEDVVLFTSRTVVKGSTRNESLEIVNRVSEGLISIIKNIKNRPKYLVAKGGITSSDIATKGLGVRRAHILGQVLNGVPVWQLGKEAKFPGLPYIVFPGNVGVNSALHELITLLK